MNVPVVRLTPLESQIVYFYVGSARHDRPETEVGPKFKCRWCCINFALIDRLERHLKSFHWQFSFKISDKYGITSIEFTEKERTRSGRRQLKGSRKSHKGRDIYPRKFYKSAGSHLITDVEAFGLDSANESGSDDWMDEYLAQRLRNVRALTKQDRLIMILWNSYVSRNPILSEAHIPLAVLRFYELNSQRIAHENLRNAFVMHLLSLHS